MKLMNLFDSSIKLSKFKKEGDLYVANVSKCDTKSFFRSLIHSLPDCNALTKVKIAFTINDVCPAEKFDKDAIATKAAEFYEKIISSNDFKDIEQICVDIKVDEHNASIESISFNFDRPFGNQIEVVAHTSEHCEIAKSIVDNVNSYYIKE